MLWCRNPATLRSSSGRLIFECERAEPAAHLNFCNNFHDCFMSARSCRFSAIASRVYAPCRKAFRLPRGAPEPAAPPCILHRRFPRTAGDLQGRPDLVLAPQRGLASIGPVLRRWGPVIASSARRFLCAIWEPYPAPRPLR
jgi:hypothetical protein